jgi:uncharacterized protein (DUF736 family)
MAERQGLVQIGTIWQKADGSISGNIVATVKRNINFRIYPIDEAKRKGENSPTHRMVTDKSNVLELSDYDKKKEAKESQKQDIPAAPDLF